MWDTLPKIIGVISAVVALLTTWIAYRQKRSESHVLLTSKKITSKLRILAISRGEPSRWPWILARWVALAFGLFWVFLGLRATYFAFVVGEPLAFIVFFVLSSAFVCVVYGYIIRALFRAEPWRSSSRVLCRAQVTTQGTFETVLGVCVAAVEAIGAHIYELNTTSGEIRARITWNWRTYGEKIKVSISSGSNANSWSIEVESDSVFPFTLADQGRNSKNVQKFVDTLLSRVGAA
jgi:hypothetical protein